MLLVIVNAVKASVRNVKLSSVSMLPVAAMVAVVIPASTEILLALSFDKLSGSVTLPPVAVMVGFPPTDAMVIPVPAVRLGVRSHVKVVVDRLVIDVFCNAVCPNTVRPSARNAAEPLTLSASVCVVDALINAGWIVATDMLEALI